MPYLTLTENRKLQLSPGLVASYDIQPQNGVNLFWDKPPQSTTPGLYPVSIHQSHWRRKCRRFAFEDIKLTNMFICKSQVWSRYSWANH